MALIQPTISVYLYILSFVLLFPFFFSCPDLRTFVGQSKRSACMDHFSIGLGMHWQTMLYCQMGHGNLTAFLLIILKAMTNSLRLFDWDLGDSGVLEALKEVWRRLGCVAGRDGGEWRRQLKTHLCSNDAVKSASWSTTPVRWIDYLGKREALMNRDFTESV